MEKNLYAVYLGGDPAPGRMGEDHEVVFVVADDVRSARKAGREKWQGSSRGHVDAVCILDVVDGYAIGLEPTTETSKMDIDVTYEPEPGADIEEILITSSEKPA